MSATEFHIDATGPRFRCRPARCGYEPPDDCLCWSPWQELPEELGWGVAAASDEALAQTKQILGRIRP